MGTLFDWSTTAGSNTTIDGTNIAENCPAANVNNGMRSIMALIRNSFTSNLQTFLAGSASLGVAYGGTGLSATPANGQLAIGNAAGFALATLTAGANITVTNGAGTVTIAATTSGGTVTSIDISGGTTGLTSTGGPITTSGSLTLGGTLIAANGGTGFNTYAVGDILFASTTSVLSKLAGVATGNAMLSGGVGTAPSWGKIGLATHVSGQLGLANGGTGGTDAATGRSGLGAAASGTNTDITSLAQSTTVAATGTAAANSIGTMGVPINSQTANYTLVLLDFSKDIYLTGTTAAQTVTIPSNASIAFPNGSWATITNDTNQAWSVAITTDTMLWSPNNTTGTRTLAAGGTCTIVKKAATRWWVFGTGLT